MNSRHPVFRFLAVYLALALVSLTPLASFQQAAFAVGLKTLLVGGLVGGAALLALGALAGPVSAIGAAGCAGTGFLSTLGGAMGAAVSGVTGICAAMGTLGMGTLGALGLMAGGALVGVMGLGLTPWLIVPALALGVGLFAYSWFKNSNYGTPNDQRYNRLFATPFFDSGTRLANQSESGARSGQTSVMDRLRSVTDTDRRDDSFFWNNRYVDTSGAIRQGNDFFSRLDQFFNGRNSGVAGWNNIYGTMNPVNRAGVAYAPKAADSTKPSSTSDELAKAEAARKAAYERLVQAMKAPQDSPAAPGASALMSDEVRQAIRDYREADAAVKEITGRLQANEKQ